MKLQLVQGSTFTPGLVWMLPLFDLPDPDVLAREIVGELKAALVQFSGIVESWGKKSDWVSTG